MFICKQNNQSQRRIFLFIAEKCDRGSSSNTRDFTEGEKIGLPEENVAQVNGKDNEYQVIFI